MTVLKWRTAAASRHPTNVVDQKKARAWVRNDPFCLDHLMSHSHFTTVHCSGQRVEVIQPDHTMPKVLLK
jgi:hypothetical protein